MHGSRFSQYGTHDCDIRSSFTVYRCGRRRADFLEISQARYERTKVARDEFNHRASPRNAVSVSVFHVQDLQRRDWWRGEWKLDHLAFDKNWKLRFFAGPTCEPSGNEENAVAVARRLVSDGIHLVFARDEPVALLNAQTAEVDLAAGNFTGFPTDQELGLSSGHPPLVGLVQATCECRPDSRPCLRRSQRTHRG